MINDINIFNWSTVDSSNLPTDGTYIGRDLPKQLRNIKSVSRTEYDLRWMTYSGTPTYLSSTSFSLSGDVTGTFVPLLPLRLVSGSGSVSLALVSSSSFGGGVTTVTAINLSGSVPTTLTYVMFGMSPTARPYTELFRYGTVTIVDANTTKNVVWGSDLSLPDIPCSYGPMICNYVSETGSPGATARLVDLAFAYTTGFSVSVVAAPGVGNSVTFNWALPYPWHTEFIAT